MNPHITGIGGIFFRSKDPRKLAKWYEDHFGIDQVNANSLWMQEAGPTVFAPFKEDTDYFGSRGQQFMLNFRVKNIDEFVKTLESNGVKVDPKTQDEEYGKFRWVYDPEENKIELWEPKEPKS